MSKNEYNLARGLKSLLERAVLSSVELDQHIEIAKSTSEPQAKNASLPERSVVDIQDAALANAGIKMRGQRPGKQTFYAPYREFGIGRRDMTVGGNASAAVGWRLPQLDPSLQPGNIVEYCSVLTGLRGNAPIVDALPSQPTWPGETGTIAETDQVFTATTMKPNLVAGQIKISRQLLLTGAPGLDEYIRREIARSILTQISTMVLIGSGSGANQPVGIANATGTNVVTLTPTWAQIVQCEANSAAVNIVDFSNFAYVINPAQLTTQKTTAKGVNLFGQLTDVDGRTNGFPTVTSTSLNGGPKLVAGPFDWVLIGLWGLGLEILVDDITQAGSGIVVLTATLFCDTFVRYPAAFSIGN
jgi:hypothetical protein